ncbi:MAG: hypothetical protein ABIN00_02150 [candidate division WOR-3 bacterium]
MKKLLTVLFVLALVFAGCSIIQPPVVDHSDTVEYYAASTTTTMYDFDQAGPSGFWISNAETGQGEAISVTGNGGVIDFYYNDRDYSAGAYFVSADGDSAVYYWGSTNDPKTTYFEVITDTSVTTAPATMTGISVVVNADAWYWVKFENGHYAKLHITEYASPYDYVKFEYWYQTDGTRYFGVEE